MINWTCLRIYYNSKFKGGAHADIFIAKYKGNCLMFVLFCCFRIVCGIVKHLDVSDTAYVQWCLNYFEFVLE